MMLSKDEFSFIVRNAPLVSIDLVVRDPAGCVLVGLRRNRPARGMWFVPGGRILKNELIADAFARITEVELGARMPISDGRFLGVFEHLYCDNALNEAAFGTHYIVLAYALVTRRDALPLPRGQHADFQWMSRDELLATEQVHQNTKAYASS